MPSEADLSAKREQVLAQCKAVAHIARALAQVNEDLSHFVPDAILDIVGKRTARQMEWLGDELNNMDAVDSNDEWMDPIFKRAHAMFPSNAKAEPR